MTVDEVRALIERGIPGARVEVRDLTGTGDHFAVRVEAAAFRGLPLVRQHMMVNAAVAGWMEGDGGAIHALKIETALAKEA